MADFTNEFWNWWIIAGTVFAIAFCFILIWWLGGSTVDTGKEAETMGHVWDEDLEELNNPLPKWWLNMFYITLVFSIGLPSTPVWAALPATSVGRLKINTKPRLPKRKPNTDRCLKNTPKPWILPLS